MLNSSPLNLFYSDPATLLHELSVLLQNLSQVHVHTCTIATELEPGSTPKALKKNELGQCTYAFTYLLI